MIHFVSGIDTEIGKTVATGLLAAWFHRRGWRTITQKMVQTGCTGWSADVAAHRRWMGVTLFPEDLEGLTCPATYPFPASPHLAAELAGEPLDVERLVRCAHHLQQRFDLVLVEGAGGLMVPLTRHDTTLDLIARQGWPVVLVTTPRLGSINHTLLSLHAIRERGIELSAVIYNLYHDAAAAIVSDTRRIIQETIARMGSRALLLDLPRVTRPTAEMWNDAELHLLLRRG